MKTRIVPASELTTERLDATHYVDPTQKVDKQIARAEQDLARVHERLDRLRRERTRILKERERDD